MTAGEVIRNTERVSMAPVSLNVPTPSGPVKLEVSPRTPLFILGRNGTGKSALVHSFVAQLGGKAIYLPGARPSYFDNESLSITPSSRKQLNNSFRQWDAIPDQRWRSTGGTSRNEKAIHDLLAAETQFKLDAANEIVRDGKDSSAVARLQECKSPLDRTNALLEQANLPIRLVIESAELKAVRGNTTYSVAKMSDGERIALVLIAEVIAAPNGSVFLIDEPEVHLHRAIVVPLVSSLMLERPDSIFVIGTHELELAASCPESAVAVLRNCFWSGGVISGWEIDTIAKTGEIPEDVRVDILGSRRKILFVEGVATSLDTPLYSLLFPNASVRSKENCREVDRAVSGLRAIEDMHHTKVFGMIDGDGMCQEQVRTFEAKGIYPLSVPAVESLYYADEVLTAIAKRQAETFGIDERSLLEEAKVTALKTLDDDGTIVHLASRIAERQIRDSLIGHLPSRTDIISATQANVSVAIPNSYPAELARLRTLRSTGDVTNIISRYPVRESGLLNALAKGLRFSDRADYERAALRQVSIDGALCDALRAKLGSLSSHLV
jgi:ABC-type cobalamin/Fe3+-siderophores transport system ATPase subunit